MLLRLLPLLVGPAILLPLAIYAYRRGQVRGAVWYAALLTAIATWSGFYAAELAATSLFLKILFLDLKYLGIAALPVAWIGFVLDFVARDRARIRIIAARLGIVALAVIILAWTNPWHLLFWGEITIYQADSVSLLIGRGPAFWLNVAYTYAVLWTGILILIYQAVRSPYLYRKRAAILIVATILPWLGNVAFMSRHEGPANIDPTPFLFACTAVLAAIAVFRYRVLDPIPTLGDARIEVIGDGLLIADASGCIADLNRAAEAQIGRSRAGVAGASLSEVLPGFPALENREARLDVTLGGSRGERVFDTRVSPIRSYRDRLTGFVVLLTDVTERRQLEAELRDAQKMEAVGKLAAGVAHDFNNLLTSIIGYATLAEDDAPPDSPSSQWLAQIRRSAEDAALITRQLLAFGRRQLLHPEVLDLNQAVAGVQKVLRRLAGDRIRFTGSFGADVPSVRADLAQIQQVLINLVVNACEAMPEGGELRVATKTVVIDDPRAFSRVVELKPGRYAAISISDTGPGIQSEVLEHIFEPFFTTKTFGQGSGLGLATVYGIVKQSGGDIVVDTSPQRGSTFTVLLPSAADQEARSPVP
jgi:PAS domain S-box-containing protein